MASRLNSRMRARKVGALRKKRRSKWQARAQPSSHCPVCPSQVGRPRCRSKLTLATAHRVSGPSIQGLGWPNRAHSQASRAPPGSSRASQGQSTAAGAGASIGARPQVNSAGTSSTTSSRRRLWAAATLAGSAWFRLARLTISLAPPGMLAKKAVARFSPARRKIRMPIRLSRLVPMAALRISARWLSTWASTSLVKCRPMPLATSHCPPLRPPGSSVISQPLQRAAMTASRAPISQGKGQPSRLAR